MPASSRKSPRRRRHAADPVVDRSLQHSVRDGMAWAVMVGGAETYLAAFALFCKASAAQVALLSTLPALLGSLGQLAGAFAARHRGRRKPVILAGAALQGLTLLPILLVPWLLQGDLVPALLLLYTLYFTGAAFAAPPWTSLMGDTVPERRRGRFFGHRTRLTTVVTFAALVAAGIVLHGFDSSGRTLAGFSTLFAVAFLARMVSVYHLARMHEPAGARMHSPLEILDRDALRQLHGNGALWFTLYVVLMQGAVGMAAPYFAVYMLRDLEFSYLEFMLSTGTAVFVQFIALNTWGRISDVFGNRVILSVAALGVPVVPLLWLVSGNLWYLVAVQAFSGVCWAGFSLSTGNLLYELVPAPRRAAYAAFHNMLTAVGVFAGAMLATLLIGVVPARAPLLGEGAPSVLLTLFMLSTAARALVDVLLLRRVRELRPPRRRVSARTLVFRVTRFNAFMGLVYEAMAAIRPNGERKD